MTIETWLQAAQLVVSLITLGGAGFAAGQFSARFKAIEKLIEDGVFMRRAEADILIEKNEQEHQQFNERLNRVEPRRMSGGA